MRTVKPECIDAHHHLWHYQPDEYPWMGEGMDILRRDYLPDDLEQVAQKAGVDGSVVVQARQSVRETEWLSGVAASSELIRAVVGWAPLSEPGVEGDLEMISALPKIRGVRHILHDEPDPFFMARDEFNRGVSLLKHYDLRYDLLIFESHLPQTIEFVDRHPNQIFIVDHLAKPRIRENILSPWRENLKELALRQNVYCKISGMVTEANWTSWSAPQLRTFIDIALEEFGARRTMFGSDWPVMLLASSYDRWVRIVRGAIESFSASEQDLVMGGTAKEVYRF